MKNHETHEFPRKVESGAALGQAKLALRFQIPPQANLHGILKAHYALAPRVARLHTPPVTRDPLLRQRRLLSTLDAGPSTLFPK